MLFQTFYHSKSIYPRGHITDLEILRVAQDRNKNLGLTGFLVRTNGAFFQYLEGGIQETLMTLEKIRTDTRHFDMTEVSLMREQPRSFSDWAMGYADVPAGEVHHLVQLLRSSQHNLAEIVTRISEIAQQHGHTPLEE